MKRFFQALLILSMVSTLILGCQKKEEEDSGSSTSTEGPLKYKVPEIP